MGQAPFAIPKAQGGVLVRDLMDPGLGVVGRQLLLHVGTLPAAGQRGDSLGFAGDLQGEGFGDGDDVKQVLHPQQGPLLLAGRRDRQQPDWAFGLAREQPGNWVRFHDDSSLLGRTGNRCAGAGAGCSVFGGRDAMQALVLIPLRIDQHGNAATAVSATHGNPKVQLLKGQIYSGSPVREYQWHCIRG